MSATHTTTVASDKARMAWRVVLGCVGCALCYWIATRADATGSSAPSALLGSVRMDHGVGWTGFALVALANALGMVRLLDKRPGLILDSDELTDYSSALSGSRIPWREITSFSLTNMRGGPLLSVHLSGPLERYALGRGVRRLHCMIGAMLGRRLSISTRLLRIDPTQLLKLCESYHARYGAGNRPDAASA